MIVPYSGKARETWGSWLERGLNSLLGLEVKKDENELDPKVKEHALKILSVTTENWKEAGFLDQRKDELLVFWDKRLRLCDKLPDDAEICRAEIIKTQEAYKTLRALVEEESRELLQENH